METPHFQGVIGDDWRDSTPWWPEVPTPPAGCPQRGAGRPRRRGIRANSGATGPTSTPRPSTGWRTTGVRLTNFHTTALCSPDPGLPADRAQPSPERPRAGGRPGHGVPGLQRRGSQGERLPLRDPAPAGLCHLRGGEVAPLARRRDQHGRPAAQLAPGPGLRPLVRVPRRRDPPVRPGPLPRQSLDPAAEVDRGGIPPERRPGRPGHRPTGRSPGRGRGPPVLPLPLHRRLPFAPPRPAVVDRALPGTVRQGLGPVAGGDLRPPARVGSAGARDRDGPTALMGAGVGRPAARPSSGWRPGSWSASPPSCPTPTPSWPGCSTSSSRPATGTTPWSSWSRTTGPARRVASTGSINDNRLQNFDPAGPGRTGTAHRRAGRARAPTTTTRGAGPWPATRRSNGGSARSTRAAWPTRAS